MGQGRNILIRTPVWGENGMRANFLYHSLIDAHDQHFGRLTYNDPVWMITFMSRKLRACAEAVGAQVHTVSCFADWVGALYTNVMCEIAGARVTMVFCAWLVNLERVNEPRSIL